MIRGDEQIYEAFARFRRNLGFYAQRIPNDIRINLVEDIYRQDSIRTGAFIQAVGVSESVRDNNSYVFFIDTRSNPDVYYDGFLEFDHVKNVFGTAVPFKGRKHYQTAIETTDYKAIFDDMVDSSFIRL